MRERYNELRRMSWELPQGKQKIMVMEKMIRIADLYMTEEDAYQTRISYLTAASEAGASEKMIIAFAWCLAKFEGNPGKYSYHELLWYYKWILGAIWKIPEIRLEQIESLFEHFKVMSEQYGYNLRAYYHKQVNYTLSIGNFDAAAKAYKLWRTIPRDGLADCKACEQNLFGIYMFRIDYIKRGMQAMKPILEGKLRCGSIPENTYSQVLLPLLKLGKYEQASKIANKAYHMIKGPEYLSEHGKFLLFFTVTSPTKAKKVYNETIEFALDSKVGWDRLEYFLCARFFLTEWHKKKRKIQLVAGDQVTLAWLDQEIQRISQAFNYRNGNDYIHLFIAQHYKNIQEIKDAYPE
ncbi:hypothetical protein J2Z69_000943 [Paenibacillus shirakamiensis]|uniref:DUF4034 domain-containing protein n=1 Tax=Paenibacillus shirakamiensis TaxID=1265935 RepID=A0ABS4JDY8_9BACL|nr:hypothetical protein [Paenibacillus shirakamiensis]MBP1999924.1 hypothetical protein [Paenibacillus shirakamiensis]